MATGIERLDRPLRPRQGAGLAFRRHAVVCENLAEHRLFIQVELGMLLVQMVRHDRDLWLADVVNGKPHRAVRADDLESRIAVEHARTLLPFVLER